jgi:hypothetical protein
MTVELGITPDHRWRFSPAELVPAVRAAGFVACGISAEAVDDDAVDAYASSGIRCHEVLALFVGDDEEATVARAGELAKVAETIGAPWGLTDFASSQVERSIQRCAEEFAGAGVGTAVEFSPLGPISSIPGGMEVVAAVRRAGGRAGLMIDS